MRGLLAIEPMYHSIVAGTKWQTRRSGGLQAVNINPELWELCRFNDEHAKFWLKNNALKEVYCKPRYKVGEVLYLKEPWKYAGHDIYIYKFHDPIYRDMYDWKNKLFMPAEAARAFIKITGIKCERLLDVSDEDCIAEGIEASGFGNGYYINYLMDCTYGYDYLDNTPQQSFISLYKFANKMAKVGSVPPHGQLPAELLTPSENIWVWAYTFEYLPNYNK